MNRLKAFGVFWYDFIIGDDWKIAFGVVVGLALSALLVHSVSSAVWWVLPVAHHFYVTKKLRLLRKSFCFIWINH
jgi:hypothetical protein